MNNTIEEDLIRQIDFKTSLIIEDIPYLLVFSSNELYRIYFINLNLFDGYKNGEKYKPHFMEIFSLFKGEKNNLFLGVGNNRHLSDLIPRLLNQEIILYSLRMNGKPFKALDPSKNVDCYKFRKEKVFFVTDEEEHPQTLKGCTKLVI
jgi:hypothetical protein